MLVIVVQLAVLDARTFGNTILYSMKMFVLSGLKAYLRGIIFVVCPEHVTVVTYCLRLIYKRRDFYVVNCTF